MYGCLYRTEEGARQNAENAFRRDIRGQMVSSLQGDIYRRQRDTSVRRQDLDLASQEMFPVVGSEPTPSPAPAATPAKDNDAPSTSRSFAQVGFAAGHMIIIMSLNKRKKMKRK